MEEPEDFDNGEKLDSLFLEASQQFEANNEKTHDDADDDEEFDKLCFEASQRFYDMV